MNELRPHGRELLDAARRQRTPSPSERERLLRELIAAAEPAPGRRISLVPRELSPSTKFLLLAALASLIAFGLYCASRVGH